MINYVPHIRFLIFHQLSPRTGVAGIHSNLLINNLLQLSGKQSNARPSCDKHYDELVELYCDRCDKPICQACLVIDHRDHPYSFIKDVFPDKKREMVKLMNEAKSKMSALRAEVLALEGEGNKLRKNDDAVSREIDTFIDATIEKHTAIMERERQRLKQEVHAKTAQQLCKLQEQKESLVESLSSMEFVNNSVDSTKKIEFLRSKKEIESKLAGLKSFAQEFHPCEKVLYKLDKKLFEEEKMQGVANIDTQTEYCLSMTGGEPGVIYTGRVWQWCEFTLTVNSDVATHHRNTLNDFRVTVLAPNEEIPFRRCVEDKGTDLAVSVSDLQRVATIRFSYIMKNYLEVRLIVVPSRGKSYPHFVLGLGSFGWDTVSVLFFGITNTYVIVCMKMGNIRGEFAWCAKGSPRIIPFPFSFRLEW